MPDGYIIRGHRHHDCIRTARDIPKYKEKKEFEQGFMTSDNEFVDRKTARIIDETFTIKSRKVPYHSETELFSEDIY